MTAYKSFFATTSLCSGLILAALAAPAWAQSPAAGQPAQSQQPGQPGEQQPAQPTPPKAGSTNPGASSVGEVVITGSRIKTTNFNSPDPLTVISTEESQLTGNVDTTQILQLSAVAANAV